MDLTTPKWYYCQDPSEYSSHKVPMDYGKTSSNNPFVDADAFPDPLCKLNLRETSERRDGVSSVTSRRTETTATLLQAPSTPGRPVFSFSVGKNLSRRSFPSKWDDAEKWLMSSSSCHNSPAHALKPLEPPRVSRHCDGFRHSNSNVEVFAEKSRVTEEVVSVVSQFQESLSLGHENPPRALNGVSPAPADVILKDKFTDDVDTILPKFRCTDPSREGFLFRNSASETMKDAGTEVHHRDAGTEMTPLGSSPNSRCHTPYKFSSPPRHNTPADRSGPLGMDTCYSNNGGITAIDMNQLKECHLAKLQLGTQYDSIASNWSSREEEEEDVSKSLRHFETNDANGFQKSGVPESRAGAASWEEEEKMKCCLRYQREEAKIQAWVNLESAKAEAQSRKLEVKIQKMRSNLEEKLMKRMANVHRRAEEWRAQARQQHSDQIQKATEPAKKIINHHHHQDSHFSSYASCGCLPCTSHH
ncbi:Remorin_C domain-containing protein [Psidium guajava]|nr:Remorin_C domain-containing protein [Psidium guajava]